MKAILFLCISDCFPGAVSRRDKVSFCEEKAVIFPRVRHSSRIYGVCKLNNCNFTDCNEHACCSEACQLPRSKN